MPSVGNSDALVAEIEEFLTGSRTTAIERALLTILVTDIVGSTSRAAEMGDADWRDLLADHHTAVRREIDRFEGREVKDLGRRLPRRLLRRAEPGAPLRAGDRRRP